MGLEYRGLEVRFARKVVESVLEGFDPIGFGVFAGSVNGASDSEFALASINVEIPTLGAYFFDGAIGRTEGDDLLERGRSGRFVLLLLFRGLADDHEISEESDVAERGLLFCAHLDQSVAEEDALVVQEGCLLWELGNGGFQEDNF